MRATTLDGALLDDVRPSGRLDRLDGLPPGRVVVELRWTTGEIERLSADLEAGGARAILASPGRSALAPD